MQPKVLGQLQPSGSGAEALFTVTNRAEVSAIVVTNTTGSTHEFSIYLDIGGSATTDDKALFRSTSLKGNETVVIDFENNPIPMLMTGSTLSVQNSTGTTVTFTAWGREDL